MATSPPCSRPTTQGLRAMTNIARRAVRHAETRARRFARVRAARRAPSKSGSAIARPLDWREAAIFVGRDDGASPVNSASLDRSPGDARSPVTATPQMLVTAQPDGLFVARNATGGRP